MQTLQWLREFEFAQQAVIAAVAVSTMCSLLSVMVVLKRMAFIGQGVSHAGFAGVGLAVFLAGMTTAFESTIARDLIVMLTCIAAAMLIGLLSRRRRIDADTAIGILLVAAMAVGVLLTNLTTMPWYVQAFGPPGYRPPLESILFGSLWQIDATRMWASVIVCAIVLLVCGLLFKEIVFFSFDESVSRVFGVPVGPLHFLILGLLAVTIVLTMMLVGVILVSALLVLPGATALQLSRRLSAVLIWSWCIGVFSTLIGIVISIEAGDLSTGPCIVAVLCITFCAALVVQRIGTTTTIDHHQPAQ